MRTSTATKHKYQDLGFTILRAIQEAKNRALERSRETGFFPFPKKVRYV